MTDTDQSPPTSRVSLPRQEGGFRSDIEGLRGIAVLLVVLFHVGIPGLRGGFIGVDVFFVLSGYLITGLLVAEMEKKGRVDLMQFYARRARRLLPASALMLLVTLGAAFCLLAPNELSLLGRTALATAIYCSNVFFARNAADYFAADVENNPLLHTWSLAVEEQFYFIWPLLIIAGLRRGRSLRTLIYLMFGLTVVSLACSVWLTSYRPNWAFYSSPARAWEFGIGGLAVMIPHQRLNLSRSLVLAFGWGGLVVVLASALFLSGQMQWPGWLAVLPVMGTAIVLVAGREHQGAGPGMLLDTPVLQFLGKMSYSWYLWHWPFLVLVQLVVPTIGTGVRLTVGFLSLGFAALAHHLVENPIRFHRVLVPRPSLSLAFAMVLTVFSVSVSLGLQSVSTRMQERPDLRGIAQALKDLPQIPLDRCYTTGVDSELRVCQFGSDQPKARIVLHGDSHAVQWFGPLKAAATENHWQLITMVKASCPASDIYFVHKSLGRAFADGCSQWRSAAQRRILEMRPDLAVLASSGGYVALDGEKTKDASILLPEWQAANRRSLLALTSGGIAVLQLRDTPFAGFDVPTCLARAARLPWYPATACSLGAASALRPELFSVERKAASDLPGVRLADLTGEFCRDGECPPMKDGEIVYRDSNHITNRFARKLTQSLTREIQLALQSSFGVQAKAVARN